MANMTAPNDNSLFIEETDVDHQRRIITAYALSLDLVSALAGDRPLSKAETILLHNLEQSRGLRFFSDVLYLITHQHFLPEAAEDLWMDVLRHKHELSTALGRNVKVTVAALDYLTNITANLSHLTLIGEAHIKEIIERSLRDGLTGLFNHTYFYQQLDFEISRHRRYKTAVSLALIDIDDFKVVNDAYGHREGDRILAAMGETLIRAARASDICCRYGGEELAVIMPSTEAHDASAIANRLQIELVEPLLNGQAVTVSIGVSSCGKTAGTPQALVERADAALYQAKRSGKNRVTVTTGKRWCPILSPYA
ncbi:MAG: GGDEF domain-containing protein [Candidatus Competibacteraceae bacterium]|nr:GGDEF domain-containing protein [Candidatus Competibacteraceae bacterium]